MNSLFKLEKMETQTAYYRDNLNLVIDKLIQLRADVNKDNYISSKQKNLIGQIKMLADRLEDLTI